jgi:hypothetical protein
VVVGGSVVGGALVLGTVVVVGRGRAVVGGAVVAGRVVGGAVTAEVRGTVGATTPTSAPTVELVVVDSRTVVSGVPTLLPAPAAAAAVVDTGQGRPPHPGGAPCPPNACTARTTTIPAVATPVATHGRLASHPPTPVPAVAAVVAARDPAEPGSREPGSPEATPPAAGAAMRSGSESWTQNSASESCTPASWQFADPTRLAARDQLGAEALHKLSRRGEHVLGGGTA